MVNPKKSQACVLSRTDRSDPEEEIRRPTATFHFAWRPFGEYRVMAELADHSTMLLTLARSREEALAKARGLFRAELRRKRGLPRRAGHGLDSQCDEPVAIYVERWRVGPAGGGWKPLEGGFCRQFRIFRRDDGCQGTLA